MRFDLVTVLWFALAVVALAGLALGVRSQFRRGQTPAGPIVPDGDVSPDRIDAPGVHEGEGEGETIAEEYQSSTHVLGHG